MKPMSRPGLGLDQSSSTQTRQRNTEMLSEKVQVWSGEVDDDGHFASDSSSE